MKKILTTILVFLGLLTVGATIGVNAASDTLTTTNGKTYKLVTTQDEFKDGNYLISYAGTNFMAAVPSGQSYFSQGALADAIVWKIATTENGITIQNPNTSKYVGNNSTKNKANEYDLNATGAHVYWDITIGTGGVAKFTNKGETQYKYLQYNVSATRFACYTGTQQDLKIYLEQAASGATLYDVTFDSKNDAAANVIKIEENKLIPQQEKPVKNGYIFTGWYKTDPETDNDAVAWNFETDVVTGAMTLYAGWEVDPYSYATISSDNLQKVTADGSGYAPYNGSHVLKNTDNTRTEFSYTTNNVMVQSSNVQFKTNVGYLYNDAHVKGYISSIEVEGLTSELTVYTSNTVITDPTGLTGTVLNSTNSVYKLPEGTEHTYFYIQAGANTPKVSAIKIQYLYDEAFAKYSVSFNAGKGVFKTDKGQALQELEGTSISGTLPTAEDLEMTAYKYTTLTGWNDGTTTYEPGAAFTVSSLTVFNAVYAVPEMITVAQAKEIANLAGTVKSDFKFKCEGIVSSIENTTTSQIQFTLKDLTGEDTIVVYNAKLGSTIYVGDHVAVTGNLINYNGATYEFTDSSYVVTDNFISSFVNSKTQKSLKAQYDSNLAPVDVDLRFGAKISLDAYREGAVYGVMAIDAASCAGFVSGATEYATADEFLAANAGIKKVECTNRAVLEDGCQFAWVITDMEGHYKNYFTAVIYMEYEGVLYLGVSTVASVASTATDYLNSEDPAVQAMLTEDVKKALHNIIDFEEGVQQ